MIEKCSIYTYTRDIHTLIYKGSFSCINVYLFSVKTVYMEIFTLIKLTLNLFFYLPVYMILCPQNNVGAPLSVFSHVLLFSSSTSDRKPTPFIV